MSRVWLLRLVTYIIPLADSTTGEAVFAYARRPQKARKRCATMKAM